MAERADLVGLLGREVAATQLASLLRHAIAERRVERLQERDPGALAARDLVELLLHPGGEGEVHVVAEMLDQQVGHDPGDRLRVQTTLLDPDVAAIDDRRDRRRVGRRPADAVLLERLDQRRLGEARRRLGEVLGRRDLADIGAVALGERREAPRDLLVVGVGVVATLGVHPGEPLEQRPGRRRPQLVRAVGQVDGRGLELLRRHLRGERALPDEPVQPQLIGLERARQRVRVAPEAGRADRLVRLLGALRGGLVDPALGHRERVAVARRR